MSLRPLLWLVLTSGHVICGVNVLLSAYVFYNMMVVYEIPPHPRYPYPMQILGMAMMCFLGWYITEHTSTRGERHFGLFLSYVVMIVAIIGIFELP